jgi:hypothetical protein
MAGGIALAFVGALVVVQVVAGDALGRLRVTS